MVLIKSSYGTTRYKNYVIIITIIILEKELFKKSFYIDIASLMIQRFCP